MKGKRKRKDKEIVHEIITSLFHSKYNCLSSLTSSFIVFAIAIRIVLGKGKINNVIPEYSSLCLHSVSRPSAVGMKGVCKIPFPRHKSYLFSTFNPP